MDIKNERPGFDPIQAKKEVDALYDSLLVEDFKASIEIIRSMGENTNTLALEPLIILLEYDDDSIRSSVAMALGKIGDKAAVEPLIKALKDASVLVQSSAVWSLGEIGDEKAIEPLELMDISRETPALMNTVRKSINRIKTRGVIDKKLYLKEQASPERTIVKEPEENRHTTAPKIASAALGIYSKALLVAGLLIAIILIIVVGVFAYSMMFPPVWSEHLPFKNNTGQYQSVIVYRNATDTTYDNLVQFLDIENESIKNHIFDDTGDKCVEYAASLHDDAERAQINCSIVCTALNDETPGHALVVFYSKDMGAIYVDPWSMNASQEDFGQISLDRIIFLRDKWKRTMPIKNPMDATISTVEYRNSGPVTYDRLMAFLSNDSTETALYVDPSYTCTDFAVHLHDAAEEQGIKSGIVAIGFMDNNTSGHSFNAFPTVDNGIVYIDDTGLNSSEKANGGLATDAVVYLQPGQYLGELPANQTNGSLDYDFYLHRKERLDAYNNEWESYQKDFSYYLANKSYYDGQLAQYNKDKSTYEKHVSQYNEAVTQYNSGTGNYTLSDLNAWKVELDNEHNNLDKAFNTLDGLRSFMEAWRQSLLTRFDGLMGREEAKWFINHPPGIVKDVNVYW
jgi:hypothetical protein